MENACKSRLEILLLEPVPSICVLDTRSYRMLKIVAIQIQFVSLLNYKQVLVTMASVLCIGVHMPHSCQPVTRD